MKNWKAAVRFRSVNWGRGYKWDYQHGFIMEKLKLWTVKRGGFYYFMTLRIKKDGCWIRWMQNFSGFLALCKWEPWNNHWPKTNSTLRRNGTKGDEGDALRRDLQGAMPAVAQPLPAREWDMDSVLVPFMTMGRMRHGLSAGGVGDSGEESTAVPQGMETSSFVVLECNDFERYLRRSGQ